MSCIPSWRFVSRSVSAIVSGEHNVSKPSYCLDMLSDWSNGNWMLRPTGGKAMRERRNAVHYEYLYKAAGNER